MKKQIQFILVVATMLLAIGAQAQSNYKQPYLGATYNYSVTGATGDTYTWVVTSDAAGNNVVSGSDVTLGTPVLNGGLSSIPITWNSNASTTQPYYLWVTEKTASTSCINKRVLPITPQANKFDIYVADATDVSDLATLSNDPTKIASISSSSCATLPSTLSNDPTNNGTTIVKYKVWMTGSTNAWSFKPTITFTGTTTTPTATWTYSASNTQLTPDGSGVVKTPGSDYCELTLVIANIAATVQTFTVTLSNGTDVTYLTPTSTTTYKSATHTIEAMPNTSAIGGN